MAVNFNRTDYTGSVPTIWRGECKILPAGFKLNNTLDSKMVVKRGTPVKVDFSTMTGVICKIAEVLDGSDADALKVKKGSYFVVGDKVTVAGDNTASATPKTISAIDYSNAGYDVFTLSANITGLTSGKGTIVEAGGTSNSDLGTSKNDPNGVVGADLEINGNEIPTLDVAYDAVVLEGNLAFPILASWKTGICMKNNPNILFVKQ